MPRLRRSRRCSFWSLLFSLALSGNCLAEDDGFDTGDDAEDSEAGPELGVRSGYSVGAGKISEDARIQRRFAGGLPIGFDLGYRLDERWFVGGYGEYTVGFTSGSASLECSECTFTALRLSIQVQYRLVVTPTYDLWVGIGAGRHWLNASLGNTVTLREESLRVLRSQSFSGTEYARFHFGSTYSAVEGIGIGPYTSVSLGTFDTGIESCDEMNLCPVARRELELGDPSLHVWFSSGVRVVFLP
jgi:hypothetical protein